jgi:hypothetical protein
MRYVSKAQVEAEYLKYTKFLFVASELLKEDDEDPAGQDDDFSEILELTALAWAEGAVHIRGSAKRGPYNQFPKSKDFFSVALQAPMFRCVNHSLILHLMLTTKLFHSMGHDMFDRLVAMIADNPIFHSPKKPQRHVKYQLGAFLIHYGQHGSNVIDVAQKLSLGEGTVHLYCKRVVRAICQLRPKHLAWQSEEARQATLARIEMFSGFPKCVGMGDGTQVVMCEKPETDGDSFMNRKKHISVSLCCSLSCRPMSR